MPWTDTVDLKKPSGVLSPYEDWDAATQPCYLNAPKDHENWQPVYIELSKPTHGSGGSAERLIKLLTDEKAQVQASDDAKFSLALLADPMADLAKIGHRRFLFVYRPQSLAHKNIKNCFDVRHVGPAIPYAFVQRSFARATRNTLNDVARLPVVSGIIDDAIGVMHERFRSPDGFTRFAKFWKQGVPSLKASAFFPATPETKAPPIQPNGMTHGVEFDGKTLDALFAAYGCDEARTYRAIEARLAEEMAAAVPDLPQLRRTMTGPKSHGTFVADLAAGYPIEDAPFDRPIVGVELASLASANTSGGRLQIFVLEAVLRMIDWADDWPVAEATGIVRYRVPLVINLSYGFSAGPKDGTGFLEREIARHVKARNKDVPTAVVIAAGNDFRRRLRAEMTVPAGKAKTVDWRVQPQDRTTSFLEIRLAGKAGCRLIIEPPTGASDWVTLDFTATRLPSGKDLLIDGVLCARLYVQEQGTTTQVTLAIRSTQTLEPPRQIAPAGAWKISLGATDTGKAIAILDVQRDDAPRGYPQMGRQSHLEDPSYGSMDLEIYDRTDFKAGSSITRSGTLSAMATNTAKSIYVVGGTIGGTDQRPSRYTASGPNGSRPGPDLAAITEDGFATMGVRAAATFSGSTQSLGGTSAAAPRVTRKIVDWLAARAVLPTAKNLLSANYSKPQNARTGFGALPSKTEPGRIARRRI